MNQVQNWTVTLEELGIPARAHAVERSDLEHTSPALPKVPNPHATPKATPPRHPSSSGGGGGELAMAIVICAIALFLLIAMAASSKARGDVMGCIQTSAPPAEGNDMELDPLQTTTSGDTIRVLRRLDEALPGGEATLYLASAENGEQVILKLFRTGGCLTTRRERQQLLVWLDLRRHSELLASPHALLECHGRVAHITRLISGEDLRDVVYPTQGSARTSLAIDLGLASQAAQTLVVLHGLGMLHGDFHLNQFRVLPSLQIALLDFDNFVHPSAPPPFMLGHPNYLSRRLRRAYLDGTGATPELEDELFALAVTLQEILLHRPAYPADAPPDSPDLHRAMLGSWLDEPRRKDRSGLCSGGSGYPTRALGSALINLLRRAWGERSGGMPSAVEWRDACAKASQRVASCPACQQESVGDPKRRVCPYCRKGFSTTVLVTPSNTKIPLDRETKDVGRSDFGGDSTISGRHLVLRRESPLALVECVGRNGMEIWSTGGWRYIAHGVQVSIRPGDRLRLARSLELRVAHV